LIRDCQETGEISFEYYLFQAILKEVIRYIGRATRTSLLGRSNLLVGDGDALASTSGTGVGLRALAASRQASSVALATVAIDFNQALDVETFHPAKIPFDLIITALFNFFTDSGDFVVGKLMHPARDRNFELTANLFAGRTANAVNIREGD